MSFDTDPTLVDIVKKLVFPPEKKVNPFYFGGRVVFFLLTFFWGWKFIFAPIRGDAIGRSFMHLINIPFHEAGHIIFSFFGEFLGVFGGTLMQVLIPVICMIAFLKKGDAFSSSFALWWTGQSFIDAAPYIYDARAGELMLLGDVTGQDAPDVHDWHVMLERLGILPYDHTVAYAAKYTGALLIILSFAWGVSVLIRQFKNLDR